MNFPFHHRFPTAQVCVFSPWYLRHYFGSGLRGCERQRSRIFLIFSFFESFISSSFQTRLYALWLGLGVCTVLRMIFFLLRSSHSVGWLTTSFLAAGSPYESDHRKHGSRPALGSKRDQQISLFAHFLQLVIVGDVQDHLLWRTLPVSSKPVPTVPYMKLSISESASHQPRRKMTCFSPLNSQGLRGMERSYTVGSMECSR